MPRLNGVTSNSSIVFDVALEHAGLDRRPHGHHFVGIDRAVRGLAEQLLDPLLDRRHAGHAADQNYFADLIGLQCGILHRHAARTFQFVEQIGAQGFQFGSADLDVQVLGPRGVGRDERKVDVRLHRGRQFHLGLFGRFLEPLQGHLVASQVDSLVLLELVGQVVDDPQVKVLATQMGIPVGRLDFEDALANLENRDVEGAAAQIEDGDFFFLAFVQPVGQRCGRRLVDDPQHVQPCDLARIFGRLALAVVKVRRYRDDRVVDRLAQVILGVLLDVGQHERADFSRTERLCRAD